MQKVIDLNYQPKKVEKAENSDFSFVEMVLLLGFSLFMAVIVLTNICGGRFW